ncbi:MAG: hypothetical protein K1X67_22210 [Fimbriimonadaceae bacterium]|nr:hypothetical protein [Fimbriimonadaceae bacterium]
MKDDIQTYSIFLSQKFNKRAVIRGLNEAKWTKRPEGTIDVSGKFLEREVTCVFGGDTVRFEFDDGVLCRVRIATRYHWGAAQGTWEHLKRRVSEQLRRPGVPDDLSSFGVRECEWTFGQTVVRAKLYERGKASKAYVYVERRAVGKASDTASMEDLFLYEAA